MSSNLATAFFRITILVLAGVGAAALATIAGVLIWLFA